MFNDWTLPNSVFPIEMQEQLLIEHGCPEMPDLFSCISGVEKWWKIFSMEIFGDTKGEIAKNICHQMNNTCLETRYVGSNLLLKLGQKKVDLIEKF